MSKMIRTLLLALVIVIMVVTVLSGCGNGKLKEDKAKSPVEGGTLRAYINEPAFIDAYNAQESEGYEVIHNIFDSLVDFDPLTSEIIPAVAESWKASDDAKVWTFTLKKGTKFHNGREVTAEDFKYAWERMANPNTEPPSDVSYHLASILGYSDVLDKVTNSLKGVKVIDKYTLEVTLTHSFADFIYVVGHPGLAPVPKEEVEKDPGAFMEKPVGNGPFMMAEPWKHDESIKIVRFDDYYGDVPHLDGVDFKILKDEDAAFLEFQAGEIDFTRFIPTGQIKSTIGKYGKSSDGYTAKEGEGVLLGAELSTYFLAINATDKVLGDPLVVRAISSAIDRKTIVGTVFEGTKKAATGMVPPGVFGFKKDAGQYTKYDPKKASKLLKEAGWADGKGLPPLKLLYNKGSGHEDAMLVIQQNLKDVGIETELVGKEYGEYIDDFGSGSFQLSRAGWFLDYPSIDNILFPLFHSDNIGADNIGSFSNKDFDTNVNKARSQTDEDERIKLYQNSEVIVLDDGGAVPIAFEAHRAAVGKDVNGLVHSSLGLTHYEDVWLDSKK